MTKWILSALLICSVAFSSHAQQRAVDEKTVRMAVAVLPPARGNPFIGLGLPSSLAVQAIFDRLLEIGENGLWQPWLAESTEFISPDTWIVRLKPNVKFSNGEPFDAKAVVAGMDYLLSPEGATTSVGSQMARIQMQPAEVIDDLTVKFSTATPSPVLPLSLAFLRIPPPAYLAEVGMEEFAKAPVGTGPFVVESWRDGRVALTRSDTSWRAPKVDRIELTQISDQAARLQALLSSSVDVAFSLSPDDEPAVEALGGRIDVRLKPEVSYLAMVTVKDSPVKEQKVRLAMNHAINRQAIIDAFLGGVTTPTAQMVHELSFGFVPELEPYAYDPGKARALLAEAGYADGFEFPILLVPGSNTDSQSIYQLIQSDLAKVGIRMMITRTVLSQYLEHIYNTPWPSLGFAMQGSGFDALSFYRTRSCSWRNAYHCDEEMMPIIQRAFEATTLEDRLKATQDAVRREAANPPGIMLWRNPDFSGLGPTIRDFKIERDLMRFHELDVAG